MFDQFVWLLLLGPIVLEARQGAGNEKRMMYRAGSWCDALDDGDELKLGRAVPVPCVRVRDGPGRSIMGLAYALHGQQAVSCTDPAVKPIMDMERSEERKMHPARLASRRVDASEQPDRTDD